jgi:hypothetical protein
MEALPMLIVFGGIIIFFIFKQQEMERKKREAYAEFQKALEGKNKKNALQKGRYYVSLFAKNDQLLEETKIQNDLHGMDDAFKEE